ADQRRRVALRLAERVRHAVTAAAATSAVTQTPAWATVGVGVRAKTCRSVAPGGDHQPAKPRVPNARGPPPGPKPPCCSPPPPARATGGGGVGAKTCRRVAPGRDHQPAQPRVSNARWAPPGQKPPCCRPPTPADRAPAATSAPTAPVAAERPRRGPRRSPATP